MTQWIDAHPLLFTVLAFPVVCTVCGSWLSMVGFELRWKR